MSKEKAQHGAGLELLPLKKWRAKIEWPSVVVSYQCNGYGRFWKKLISF